MKNYKVTAWSLNVRSEPSLEGYRVGILRKDQVIPKGQIQADQDEPNDRNWMKINILGGPEGWASMKFLEETDQPANKNEYRVTASVLNVRSEPSIEGDPIGILKKNQKVPAGEKSGDGRWMKIELNELTGWSSLKYLVLDIDGMSGDPLWLPIALAEVGIKEYSGSGDNPRIVEYHNSTTLGPRLSSQDETAWCSSFVNWCVEKAGYEGTDSAVARSWEKWGKKLNTPIRGCIAVFKRGSNPRKGHVGFYIGETEKQIQLLGGNQSDAVNITSISKSRLLSYRWLD